MSTEEGLGTKLKLWKIWGKSVISKMRVFKLWMASAETIHVQPLCVSKQGRALSILFDFHHKLTHLNTT
jgi:hypothetical protein